MGQHDYIMTNLYTRYLQGTASTSTPRTRVSGRSLSGRAPLEKMQPMGVSGGQCDRRALSQREAHSVRPLSAALRRGLQHQWPVSRLVCWAERTLKQTTGGGQLCEDGLE